MWGYKIWVKNPFKPVWSYFLVKIAHSQNRHLLWTVCPCLLPAVIMCMCTLCVCLLCVWLTWIVCCDTDKWRCTLSSGSQRFNPSWLSLLIAPSYYLSVKKRDGGPASVRQKTVNLHGAPVLSPGCNFHSLCHFLILWTLRLTSVIQHFATPCNLT